MAIFRGRRGLWVLIAIAILLAGSSVGWVAWQDHAYQRELDPVWDAQLRDFQSRGTGLDEKNAIQATDAASATKSVRMQLLMDDLVLGSFRVQQQANRDVDPPARWREYHEEQLLYIDYMLGLANSRREALEYAEEFLGDHPTHARVIALAHDAEFDRLLQGVSVAAHSAQDAAQDVEAAVPVGAELLPWTAHRARDGGFSLSRWATFEYLDRDVRCSAAHVARVKPGPRCEGYAAPRSVRRQLSNSGTDPAPAGPGSLGTPAPDPATSPTAGPASGT